MLGNADVPVTREAWLGAFALRASPLFTAAGAPLPRNVRISIGFPSTGNKGKRIGECWGTAASADGHFEIFLTPTLASDERIADVLTHELVHAAAGLEAGHGKAFKRIAVALGLTGKMTATVAGAVWHAWARPIIADLGPMPGAPMASANGRKKQTTRMIKVTCASCGCVFRLAAKWAIGPMNCPVADCGGHCV